MMTVILLWKAITLLLSLVLAAWSVRLAFLYRDYQAEQLARLMAMQTLLMVAAIYLWLLFKG